MGSVVIKHQNRYMDVKISHLTTENGKISPLMTCRAHPRLFVKQDEKSEISKWKKEQMVRVFFSLRKEQWHHRICK